MDLGKRIIEVLRIFDGSSKKLKAKEGEILTMADFRSLDFKEILLNYRNGCEESAYGRLIPVNKNQERVFNYNYLSSSMKKITGIFPREIAESNEKKYFRLIRNSNGSYTLLGEPNIVSK